MMVLETFISKIGTTLAVMILIGVVVGIGTWMKNDFDTKLIDEYAEKVANTVANVQSAQGDEIYLIITFDDGGEGVYLSPTVSNDPYVLRLFSDGILLTYKSYKTYEPFQTHVYTFNPHKEIPARSVASQQELESYNQEIKYDTFEDAEDIVVMKWKIDVGGKETWKVFVYLD